MMKYRLTGTDLDGEHKQLGHASSLKLARQMKRQLMDRGLPMVFIQNTTTGKIYR